MKTMQTINRNQKFLFIFLFILTVSFTQIYAQTVSISGKVTSSRLPVRNASVTFIDQADTTQQYTAITDTRGEYQLDVVTSVNSNSNSVPAKFNLGQSYPNPFSSSAAIPYVLNKESNVDLIIYDILGRVVRKYEVGRQSVGTHNILWDGRNSLGQRVATGIYFYRLNAGGDSQVKKMIFNQGKSAVIPVPSAHGLTGKRALPKSNTLQNMQAGVFSIRIQNTDKTLPFIVLRKIDNVTVQNDTTINFSVESRSMATINFDSLRQIIRGFGAANILAWRPDMTDSEIETAFGTGDGQLGFTILRLRIQPQKDLWYTNVPTAKKAYDMGAKIIAAPWNAPSEMLESENVQRRVRYDMYDDYAAHLDSFNTYMTNNGVPLYGISVQNEPDYAEDWTGWTSDEMLTFTRDYADAIEGTNVMAPESFQFRKNMSDPILNDSAASANTDIICGHIYGGGLAEYPLAEEKGKEVWMTEHLTASDETENPNSMDLAIDVAEEMNAVMNAGMNAYVWWYIVRFYGPISDGTNNSGRKGEVTKKGYVMSQFSRFVRPGFYRVESNVAPILNNVRVSAYKDPSSPKVVIVAVNPGVLSEEQIFRMKNNGIPLTFTPYTTNIAMDCEEGDEFTVTEDTFAYTLLPLSITTFVSD